MRRRVNAMRCTMNSMAPHAGIAVLLLAALDPVARGRVLFEQNRFAEARGVLQTAVAGAPRNAEARYWLGFTHFALGELEAALVQLERAEPAYGSDPEFAFAIAEVYTRRARQLSESLSQLPDASARRHQHFAHRHLARGDAENALRELRLAMERGARVAGLHQEAAEILWRQEKRAQAAAEWKAELGIAPLAFGANLRYGQYLLGVSEAAKALPHLVTAARYRRYPEAHQLLAHALRQLSRGGEARAVVEDGLAAFPRHEGLAEMLAGAATKPFPLVPIGDGAGPSVAALRARTGTDEHALFRLHEIYTERAEEWFAKLEKLAPGSARVSQAKALNAEYADDFAAAETLYREALKQAAPRTPGLRFSLGHVLRMGGKLEEADRELAAEIELDAGHHLAWFERGLVRMEQGAAAAAAPFLEKALALRPGLTAAQVELAKAHLQSGQPAKAAALLEAVVRGNRRHPSAHFLLSRAYRAMGDAFRAARELEAHVALLGR